MTVDIIPAQNGDVAAALRNAAANFQADILAMGGYVHSRLREMLLVGVTQSLLRDCNIPLLSSY